MHLERCDLKTNGYLRQLLKFNFLLFPVIRFCLILAPRVSTSWLPDLKTIHLHVAQHDLSLGSPPPCPCMLDALPSLQVLASPRSRARGPQSALEIQPR